MRACLFVDGLACSLAHSGAHAFAIHPTIKRLLHRKTLENPHKAELIRKG